MKQRRSILVSIWSDPWFEELTPNQKLCWIYLLTNSHCNLLGIYELSAKKGAFESGLSLQVFQSSLDKFTEDRKIILVDNFIIILNHLKNQALNPNMETSAEKNFNSLPNVVLEELKLIGIDTYETLYKGLGKGSLTLQYFPSISSSIVIPSNTMYTKYTEDTQEASSTSSLSTSSKNKPPPGFRPDTTAMGPEKNVWLKPEEFEKLCTRFDSEDVKAKIVSLDTQIENGLKPYITYKNHNATIRNWLTMDERKKESSQFDKITAMR